MHLLERLWRTSILLGLSKWTKHFPQITIPVSFCVVRKLKLRKHLAIGFHLGTKNETPRQYFCKEPSTLSTRFVSTCVERSCSHWNGNSTQKWNLWYYRYGCAGEKIDFSQYRHQKLHLRMIRMYDLEILLRDVSNDHVCFSPQFFLAYGLNHAREILTVTTTGTANRSEVYDAALLGTPPALREAASVFCRVKFIGFKRCLTFSRLDRSLGLKVLC